jgi:Do/DeqQ family serine protease
MMKPLVFLVLSICLLGCGPDLRSGAAAQTPPERAVPASRGEIALSFAPVVRRAAPAVVSIYTRKTIERRRSPFAGDPFFEQFFGDRLRHMPQERAVQNSLGSGVIVDPSGITVSNHHVVAGADEITVVLSDWRELRGEVILADEASDLAVIRVRDASGLPALTLRDSDTLEVGDLVLAIGNPFGVGQTVTSGIVSALARTGVRAGRGTERGYFIQTDAAINPGNSGGALVDMEGRLVGVPTSILSRTGGSIGIGFAVPSNLVARVIEAAQGGDRRVERPWLGLRGDVVTGETARALALDPPRGVVVSALDDNSPLARAGLRPGDVVLALDGAPVNSPAELAFRAATVAVGEIVRVETRSGGRTQTLSVRLGPAPETPPRDRTTLRDGRLRGATVSSINPAVIEERGLPLTSVGVLVEAATGRAQAVGLRAGDLVLSANRRAIETVADLRRLALSRGRLALEILRGEQRGVLVVGG